MKKIERMFICPECKSQKFYLFIIRENIYNIVCSNLFCNFEVVLNK